MHRVSASASRSLPNQDLRRYSYKLSYPDEGQKEPRETKKKVCLCALPERPDNWTDNAWRKYLTMMARLPCQVCKSAAVIPELPTRSSLPVGNTTSMMRLLSKGKKHYSKEKKEMAKSKEKQQQLQQQQQQMQLLQQQQDGVIAGQQRQQQQQQQQPQEAPFCATAPSSAADVERVHPVAEGSPVAGAVVPRRQKGAAPWEEG